jgi:uncharacterized protein YbbC (DUF1343 family)/CubicO group peptidase (beta-lactamase class C family)
MPFVAVVTLALGGTSAQAAADAAVIAPRFERVVLDEAVGIGYGVAIADVDGDGRDDLLLIDQHEVRAYVAPRFDRRAISGKLSERDHVCLAARDVDGKPGCELAVGGEWNPDDTLASGALFLLAPPADRGDAKSLWSARELPHEPTLHRMKWIVDRRGRASLVVVPLHGRGNRDGQGDGARILEYLPPTGDQTDWTTRLVDSTLHQAHNLAVVEWDGDADEELLVAAHEGVFLFDRDGERWTKRELVGPHAGHPDFRGASEVRLGRFANGRRYLATVEPFHGNSLVVYVEPAATKGIWTRRVLDDSLSEAHALACGDLLSRGDEQIVVGWRRPDARGKTGLRLFAPVTTDPPEFVHADLDDHVACEDLALGDLDGDGKPDLVAAGRASHDLVLFKNRTEPPRAFASLERAPIDVAAFARIDEAVAEALAQKRMPGCVVAIGRHDGLRFLKAYGARSLVPARTEMTTDTLFDLASLTKPLATATAIALLAERGKLSLADPLVRWLPEFAAAPTEPAAEKKRRVTLRDCLLHVAGFPPDDDLSDYDAGAAAAWAKLFSIEPASEPGAQFTYSDVGYEMLAKVVERVSGRPIDAFTRDEIYAPLKMTESGFNPGPTLRGRAAPTEPRDGAMLEGEVHDPRAAKLGGVAGHAGLFSTAGDLARYARMLLCGGQLDGVRVLQPQTVALLTTPEPIPGGGLRTPGFDAKSRYSGNRGELMTSRAFGHGGFTGTGLWIDPGLDLFVLFLSNRVHPDGKGLVNPLIGRIGTIAAAAVGRPAAGGEASDVPVDAPPAPAVEGAVRTGLDVARARGFSTLRGRRIGLVTNQTGRASDGASTFELLAHDSDLKLVALYSPEHGLGGRAEGPVADAVEPKTGLPIRSLYDGKGLLKDAFKDVDTLVVDLQDAGARCYTYVGTMVRAMEAAAGTHVRFVVLDRPDPAGGLSIEGPLPDPGEPSLTNWHPVAFRHGMTIGELANMVRAERKLDVELEVVPLDGWKRAMLFDETQLPWNDPSPNLRGVEATLLYGGLVLFEPTNLSVGRGTERPFEQIGAPWLDGRALVAALAADAASDPKGGGLPGATAMAVEFTPTTSVYSDQRCGGVRFQIADRAKLEPLRVALAVACALRRLYPKNWQYERIDALLHSRATIDALKDSKSAAEIAALWQKDVDAFKARRAPYLIYK